MSELKDILNINERFHKLVDELSSLWTDVLTLRLEGEKCKCGKSYRQHFIDDSYKTCKYFTDSKPSQAQREVKERC